MRSFLDLEEDKNVVATEVVAVLEEYATSGAAISARTVISLINHTNPSASDREKMKASAQKGKESQSRRNFPGCANEYEKVLQHLNQFEP
jgi:hypothetical protein